MPPLNAAPSHEFLTLLTIFRQAERIKTLVVGVNQKTLITLDMGLYKPAKQLEYALECCRGKWILQPGELHTVMAQLRTIGSYIESSGLDDVWTESDIYGPATVKQILQGKNMKRGIEAHVTTLQALFSLYAEEFFIQHPKLKEDLQSHVKAIDEAWEKGEPEAVRTAHSELIKLLESSNDIKQLNEFDKKNEESSPCSFEICKTIYAYGAVCFTVHQSCSNC